MCWTLTQCACGHQEVEQLDLFVFKMDAHDALVCRVLQSSLTPPTVG